MTPALERLFSEDGRFASFSLDPFGADLGVVRREGRFVVLCPARTWDERRAELSPFSAAVAEGRAKVVILGHPRDPDFERALDHGVFALVSAEPSGGELALALSRAFETMALEEQSASRGKWLSRYRYELSELIDISRALTTEREIDRLLALILEKSRFVTAADAASIYVVERGEEEAAEDVLRFKLSQNESVEFDSREFSIPLSRESMAGYVALERRTVNIEDVYRLPADSPFRFDRSFDVRTNYVTRSVLATPLVTSKGDVIGVLQLINKKRDPKARLRSERDVESIVVPFDARSGELLETLAAQAGIALENALLYEEIRGLFEGFVRASVDAIEARDPTTSGHSRRVATLTVGLAHAVEREASGPYREVEFTREDVRELEYASLLHDFGKIGVREHVLVKAKKLFPEELALVRKRFDFVIRSLEADALRNRIEKIRAGAPEAEIEAVEREFEAQRDVVERAFQTVLAANEPTVLAAGDFARIEELGRMPYTDLRGEHLTLLTADEVRALSVARGSLTSSEFDEIRSHVSHTYRFLSQIPWGKTFSRVPTIAGSHHERPNGTGYPNRLSSAQIPLQSKMMSVSDIFDALTASDRPYKRAVPVEKALDILGFEVKDGHLDGELVRIFREARPWEQILGALY
ncbi:MAG TPA: HD domain-containing phosphohydrolase [Polyangiaceae bacterium]|nr:HD domain-containing phosphohydrolase [Polyangiaceae bacterium]